MIDFRYHIVSLISVFLALAVGIALGAGPLEATIGSQLTEQVDQLRTEKDELRAQLSAQEAVSAERARFIEETGAELLHGVLPRTVAVVTLAGVDDAVVSSVVDRLGQAGAAVTARLALTPAWTDPDQQAVRGSLVGNVSAYLDPAPSADASTDAVLGQALAQALTAAAPDDPATFTEEAGLILEVLTSGQLVSVTVAPGRPADAVVVLAPAAGGDLGDDLTPLVETVTALARNSSGAVVGGPATSGADLVALVRGGPAADVVATVDHVSDVSGRVALPRALARAVAGDVGHFGFAQSAESVLPDRASLVPVEP